MRKCLVCVGAIWAFASSAQAQERFTEPFGGRGGQQFISRCPSGAELTGVSALTGAFVNGIAPICDGQQGRGFGGSGDKRSAECPQGSVVSSVFMISLRSEGHNLKMVRLGCVTRSNRAPTANVDLDTPGRYTFPDGFITAPPGYPHTMQTCGAQHIVGLQGRFGSSIDALGLICG